LKSKAERPMVSNNPFLKAIGSLMFCWRRKLLIQTQLNGIYRLTGTSLSKFSTEVDSKWWQIAFTAVISYQMAVMSLVPFLMGFLFWPEGKVKYHISQNKGWVTMVLSLFEDADKTFGWDWIMGLIALIFSLPLKKYVDDTES
jgi:hypothetical protein